MRAILVVLALATLLAALPAPTAEAQLGPASSVLYLRSLQAPLPGVGSVETLSADGPVKAEESTRNLSAGGAAWYAVPGAARALNLGPTVSGTTAFRVSTATVPVFGALVTATVNFDLRRVGNNGTETTLGNTTAQFTLQTASILAPAQPQNVTWTLSPGNASLAPGETLGLNITAALQPPGLGELTVIYDSTAFPSSVNLTLVPAVTGAIQLSTSQAAKEAAAGGTASYSVFVRNLAGDADTARLAVAGEPADWNVTLSRAELPIAANGTAGPVLVTVRAPAGAAQGARHTATLTATTQNGAPQQTLQLTTTIRAAPSTCTVGGLLDTDCDGWSDVDERRYASNPNSATSTPDSEDTDGDGVSNRAEIDAGTDYQDPNDFPGSGRPGGPGGRAGGSIFGPSGDSFAQSLGVNAATGDLIMVALLLLFLLVLAALVWFLVMGYPVSVKLVEAKASTEPGRSADFSVVVRSRVGKPQAVDLEVQDLPPDWDARLSNPRLQLGPKARETIGLLVRPPADWPAPSLRDFRVMAVSRLRPAKSTSAAGKLAIQAGAGPAPPPAETGVPEPPAWPAEEHPAAAPPYVPPTPTWPGAGAPASPGSYMVMVSDVVHDPPVPERGGEVRTTARVRNDGPGPERVRVVLVVNGKVRDEAAAELGPGESAEAEFRWTAHLPRNEVKVVAERQ